MSKESPPQLPAANEFTVGQLGGGDALFALLEMVTRLAGNRDQVIEEIRQRWFSESAADRTDSASRLQQQQKRAANVISGMRQYGLLTEARNPLTLSSLGIEVLKLSGSKEQAYAIFSRFLLRERKGLELLEFARAVKSRLGMVTKKSIDAELISRGYRVSTNSSYSGKLRGWLELSGVVDADWNVDDEKLALVAGVHPKSISAWQALTPEQQATLIVLRRRNLGNTSPIQSSDLLELLRQSGIQFDAGQVKSKIYDPLFTGGWIVHSVAAAGRGGKGGLVSPTAMTLELEVDSIDDLELGNVPADLQAHLSLPTADIIDNLSSTDINVKGTALELLSLRLAADIGLHPIEMRLRSAQTGGAEVDLIAEGAHLHFSRWLFQCKNQVSNVGLAVLAKEIGMATLLRAQVVVIVTTGSFASSVIEYARQASEISAIQVVLLNGASLKNYRERGSQALRAELHRFALDALKTKRKQLAAVPVDE